MAEGWARRLGGDRIDVRSASIGTDISNQESTRVCAAMIAVADVVVTACGHADEHCPVLPPGIENAIALTDSAKATGSKAEIMAQFRATRRSAATRRRAGACARVVRYPIRVHTDRNYRGLREGSFAGTPAVRYCCHAVVIKHSSFCHRCLG